jgi:recombinational DNA repair ATPase RecF
VVKEQRQAERQEFMDRFFLPLRQEFEDNIGKYEKLWPIKDKDMAEETVQYEIIYAYENVVSERKIQ